METDCSFKKNKILFDLFPFILEHKTNNRFSAFGMENQLAFFLNIQKTIITCLKRATYILKLNCGVLTKFTAKSRDNVDNALHFAFRL